MRSRLGVAILLAFVAFAAVSAVVNLWYGYRVVTELRPGSWRTPTEILDRDGETLLALYGAEWRRTDPVVLEDLPDHIPNAFLAAEDVRFRSHFGLDPVGIGRAALTNVKAGGIAQGGSTITQQLAKTRFLSAERTFTRKAKEAVLAPLIELRLSKDEILEAYLNDVYLGHRDGRSILGLDEAALAYFNKKPGDLNVAEAALLAGMIRAPNRDNPEERARVARERRNAVLGVMRDRGWIDEDDHDRAVDQRVRFRTGTPRTTPHPYLVAALRAEIADLAGARRLRSPMKIYTAVDGEMQRAAESAVRGGTQRLRNRYRWLRRKDPLQAAILSVDPETGGIRALVGGSDFRKSQFDRTRRMRRQPGSAFKPFTYAAAIAGGKVTAATVVEDKPVEIQLARNDIWRPRNYDERFRGDVTVREAFEKSLNAPAVRIADEIGVRRVRNVLDDAGIEGELSDTPAIALGVDEVSMRELVSAYTVFPNLGYRSQPHLVDRIENANGRRIYRFKPRKRKALDPAVAYVVHSLMRGVVQRGTGSDLKHLGLGHLAGKTGTTNDYRDAWFVGYAPDLLTAAWVGFDDGTPLRISSGEAALPIWAAYMAKAGHKRADIAPPDGVVLVDIEPASGLLWKSGCGDRFEEAFLAGTEPEEPCRRRIDRAPIFVEFEEPPVI
ncbi:MAG TPA: PBP1A family penicillin-binding protein, partial [Thermoanaerobaculia bacterium]|nr:PBP1A family penicillin-binding protein [Thermoanaerobaculia bacterium]